MMVHLLMIRHSSYTQSVVAHTHHAYFPDTHLVPGLDVGPGSKQGQDNLEMALNVGANKGCPTTLRCLGSKASQNHEWPHALEH